MCLLFAMRLVTWPAPLLLNALASSLSDGNVILQTCDSKSGSVVEGIMPIAAHFEPASIL